MSYNTTYKAVYLATSKKYYLYLFLLWPFLALVLAISNFRTKESKQVVFCFFIYYGLTFIIGNSGVDAQGYATKISQIANLPFSDFFKIFGNLYSSGTTVDFIEPFITFLLSRFFTNYKIFFAVWAAIFGFFYLKSISKLHDRYQENPGINAMIFMAFFILVIPITTINGIRMYTAAWIFFYGAYHVVVLHNFKYLPLAILSSFLHFSYIAANIILLLYIIIGNKNYIYVPLVIMSFILPKLISPVFNSISLFLGGSFQNRYEIYTGEGYLIARQDLIENASWFMQIGNNLIFYYLLIAIVVTRLKLTKLSKNNEEINLFSFLLLFLAFTNFASAIPTFGGRFQTLFCLFATLYLFLGLLQFNERRIMNLTLLGLFPMGLYVAVVFRMGSESLSAWLLTPVFGIPWIAPSISVADLLFH
jgi:hypothetical protein